MEAIGRVRHARSQFGGRSGCGATARPVGRGSARCYWAHSARSALPALLECLTLDRRFDRIKLDASFVAAIDQDGQAVSILQSVVALGRTLSIPVLAEGIEEDAQLRIVADAGCSAIQGHLIGRPSRDLVSANSIRSIVNQATRGSGANVSLVA
ncbi:EAL domain-containing protein [Sphingomonas aurantiaca]|uniref:EAL domain-containing protein n=1 Tax=Sphingomonas aurantiaca TaxID=185949 RepID=UPI00125EC9D4|nr:EAL domain-containing protein [Sphingomonas aurantiaca]